MLSQLVFDIEPSDARYMLVANLSLSHFKVSCSAPFRYLHPLRTASLRLSLLPTLPRCLAELRHRCNNRDLVCLDVAKLGKAYSSRETLRQKDPHTDKNCVSTRYNFRARQPSDLPPRFFLRRPI